MTITRLMKAVIMARKTVMLPEATNLGQDGPMTAKPITALGKIKISAPIWNKIR